MTIDDVTKAVKDTMTVSRVYSDPIERGGTTLIEVAAVSGGAGGGDGGDEHGNGSGAGFGVGAKPVGVYVVTNGKVAWRPAIDVNRLMLVVGTVAVGALIVGARMAARR
ncbi:spore germination protein GerW family protein [Nocardia thailandica]|uniref:Spore germination protein GerW family protein n=1 Tax=Nocardia thailandica TaxID=257275 RepID=A0ABW6PU86_9NOCA